MTQEKEIPGILKKIVDKAIKERQEQASIEEAQEKVAELGSKILDLLELNPINVEEEQPLTAEELNARHSTEGEKMRRGDLEEMAARVAVRIRVMFEPIRKTFLVPVNEEKLEVFLTKGGKSNSFTSTVDRGLEVNVKLNDSYLRINEGMAFIISGIILMMVATYTLFKLHETLFTSFIVILLEPAGWFLFWEGMNQVIFGPKKVKADLDFYGKMAKCMIRFTSK